MNPPKVRVKPGHETCEDATTHEKILEAARAEFIENGLRGARMQEIADRAGVNKALLHYHFGDKEELYRAALESVIVKVKNVMASVATGDAPQNDPEALIRFLVHRYMYVLRENPQAVGMMLRELADGGKFLEPLVQLVAPMAKRIFGTVHDSLGEQAHTATHVDPAQIFISLFSMVWGTFLLRPMYSRVLPLAGVRTEFGETFLDERTEAIADMVIAATLPRKRA